MSTADRSIALESFKLGMNNRLPDFKLKSEDRNNPGVYLRSATNADITDGGSIKRRKGATRVHVGADCHSFWADGDEGFFVDGSTMYRITGAAEAPVVAPLLSGLAPGAAMSFARGPAGAFYSNSSVIGRIERGAVVPLTPPALPAPELTGTISDKPPKSFIASVAYIFALGEMGPATLPVSAWSSDGVTLSGLPAAWPAGVAGLAVYVSTPGGDAPMHIATLSAPQTSLSVGDYAPRGGRCPTLFLAPMPAGHIVRYLNGRLLVASDSTLYYSEPYQLGMYNPAKNYIPFPESISILEPCQNGFYLAADQTYWIDGDIEKADANPVLPYGAVPGASGQVPHLNSCFWMSQRGIVMGTQDGQVTNLQEDRVAVAPAASGAVLFREEDGMKQIVAPVFGPGETVMAARSYMDAEVIRKGTEL